MKVFVKDALYYFLLKLAILIFLLVSSSLKTKQILFLKLHRKSNVNIISKFIVKELQNLFLFIKCCEMEWVPVISIQNNNSHIFTICSFNFCKCLAFYSANVGEILGLEVKLINNHPQLLHIACDRMSNK